MILLTGASGYVGSLLLERFTEAQRPVRCLSRNPPKLADRSDQAEIVQGDVLAPESLQDVFRDIDTAYYLIHSMGHSADFEETDRIAAQNFGTAAKNAGVRRIIYLGGLGDESDRKLSPHLRSRHEVGRILRDCGVQTIEFRSSAILGSGSLSFELICSLTERLPIMLCPRWLATPTQPIAADDLLAYLIEAIDTPITESRIFDIGGSDVVTYGELIKEYARQRGLKRWLISVPVLTPYLSGLWLGLVTPATAQVGRHLIEGLRNPTVVMNHSAQDVFSVRPMGVAQAIERAIHNG